MFKHLLSLPPGRGKVRMGVDSPVVPRLQALGKADCVLYDIKYMLLKKAAEEEPIRTRRHGSGSVCPIFIGGSITPGACLYYS
jgi:hypothetical protein